MVRFEREFWQAAVHFGGGGSVDPSGAARFLTEIGTLPLGEVQWSLPSMMPGAAPFQFELGPAGRTQIPPDFVIGTSATGWILRLSAGMLVVRHQELVTDGMRQLQRDQFPTEHDFSNVVARVLEALPANLSPRRTSLAVNYAMLSGDIYPASLLSELAGRGTRHAAPPPDGLAFTAALTQVEFETVLGQRYVWNDLARVGNWFGPNRKLLNNAAVVWGVDLKTASTEPNGPVEGAPTIEALPPLTRDQVVAFFAIDGK